MFNTSELTISFKQKELNIEDLWGLFQRYGRLGQKTIFNRFYTRIDQAFILWGMITAIIFITAHFFPISWHFQAILWSIITIIGSILMALLTYFWAKLEHLRWVIYLWIGLMLFGLGITDLGIFGNFSVILINLCPIWLGLTAIGYIIMGFGMGSQTFIMSGLFHSLGLLVLPYFTQWQFLITGSIITGCLLILAELQWDMRSTYNLEYLSIYQKNPLN
ncbi:MAG TPA: hypothetical protein DCF68_02755 [Cyanothece sp. UBA12306]|nr:hypothetical protein [Cyanothece sp. UBA12306]